MSRLTNHWYMTEILLIWCKIKSINQPTENGKYSLSSFSAEIVISTLGCKGANQETWSVIVFQ